MLTFLGCSPNPQPEPPGELDDHSTGGSSGSASGHAGQGGALADGGMLHDAGNKTNCPGLGRDGSCNDEPIAAATDAALDSGKDDENAAANDAGDGMVAPQDALDDHRLDKSVQDSPLD